MKRFSRIGYTLILSALVALMLITLSSCWLADGEDEVIIAPQVNPMSPPRLEKILADYTDYNANNERKVYSDNNATMPVNTGDNVYFVIDLINKSEVTFNKAIIEGGGEERVIYAKDFDATTTPTQLRIKWEITETESQMSKYYIKKLYYNAGSQVNLLELYEDDVSFILNVNPTFNISINEQNGESLKTTTLNYKETFSDTLAAVTNKADDSACPRKKGGWVFKGYFTKPNGTGLAVKPEDVFYFWADTTLYAHYERLYTFTVKSCKEYGIPNIVEKTVDKLTNEEKETTYDKVAIITKKTDTGDLQNNLEIFDTIIDDDGNELPIVEIGDSAFTNTVSLRRLTIGKYVMRIGNNAFQNSKLTTISFKENGRLTYIGDNAFFGTAALGTTMLTAMTLPSTVNYLGDKCFYQSGWAYSVAEGDMSAKQAINIYDNITHIGDWCFTETGFSSVNFFPGVQFRPDARKGSNYVLGKDDNGEIKYAESDYYLGWCLFKDCEKLKTVTTRSEDGMNNGLMVLPDGIFSNLRHESNNNSGITNVSLAEGLIKIGKGAFYFQNKLKSINFPISLENICSDNGINGPNGKFGTSNERSEYGSFEECHALGSIFFPEGSRLKILGANAFRNCSPLQSIRITSKVFEKFGDAPFQQCSNLNEVYFDFDDSIPVPTPITGYKRGALTARSDVADLFYANMRFKVFVGENVVDAFRSQLKLGASTQSRNTMQIFANEMVHELKDKFGVVYAKMALEEVSYGGMKGWNMGYFSSTNPVVVIPDEYDKKNIIQIGAYAFSTIVKSVTLGQYTLKISDSAFMGCELLEEVHFGNVYSGSVNQESGRNRLQEIGEHAFYGTAIRYFIGGTSLKFLGNEVFMLCEDLQFVDLKKCGNLNKLGVGEFNGCSSLEYVRLPETVNVIEDATFSQNDKLKAVVIESTSVTGYIFPKAIDTYFSSVSNDTVTCYTRTQAVCDIIKEAHFLPRQLEWDNGVLYTPNKFRSLTPDPDEIILSLYCTDPDAQYKG